MDRRKFIKSSAGGLAVGVAGPTELGKMIIPNWKNISVEEMELFIAQQDQTLDRIDKVERGGVYIKSLVENSTNKEMDLLFKDSMKTLLLSGNFVSLSTDAQMHPLVQKRLWDNSRMVDESIAELVSGMKSLSQEDLSGIKEKLNTDPQIEENIEKMLVAEAELTGAPKKRIRRLRKMIRRQFKKIKHSPGLVIDKYVHKYEKLISRVDTEEDTRKYMVANMGEEAFKKKVAEAEKASLRWKELDPELYEKSMSYNIESGIKKDTPAGLILLGIGALVTGIGLLLLATETALVVGLVAGITVGPALIVVALIMLLVHAIRNK